jgi:hypothetical protein
MQDRGVFHTTYGDLSPFTKHIWVRILEEVEQTLTCLNDSEGMGETVRVRVRVRVRSVEVNKLL